MHKRLFKPVTALCLVFFLFFQAHAQQTAPVVAGWVEYAKVFPNNILIKAKLDTGAKTTSINAENMQFYEIDNKQHVRFRLINFDNDAGLFDYPVIRTAKIKRHFGNQQKRPVIQMTLCLGNRKQTVEVTLVDRTGFNYQLLLGRNFLKNNILVNSAKTYLLKDGCSSLVD
ncbi:MAG: hypothetical protein HKP55_07460 [Gammaproteobacteria bacterium]|nr:hypothetical protein [Gammaproteobacteria bacterium]